MTTLICGHEHTNVDHMCLACFNDAQSEVARLQARIKELEAQLPEKKPPVEYKKADIYVNGMKVYLPMPTPAPNTLTKTTHLTNCTMYACGFTDKTSKLSRNLFPDGCLADGVHKSEVGNWTITVSFTPQKANK